MPSAACSASATNAFRRACVDHFLPIAYVLAFVVGLTWPWLGVRIHSREVLGVPIASFLAFCTVFFLSGLSLRSDELKDAFSRRAVGGSIYAVVAILGLTPLLGFAVRRVPLTPPEFVTGLTIFCMVPTTLGIGISLVKAAKGNVSLAVFLTVSSNLLSILFIPLWLRVLLTPDSRGVATTAIDSGQVFAKLLATCLVPTLVGKAARDRVAGCAAFQEAHALQVSMLSNALLAFIIWLTVSGSRQLIVGTPVLSVLGAGLGTGAIHAVYLVCNAAAVRALRLPAAEGIAVVVLASQKAAPVAVAVIMYVTPDPQMQGLLALPALLGQLVQIFMGQALVGDVPFKLLPAVSLSEPAYAAVREQV